MPMLAVRNLVKRYGEVLAVNRVSFDVLDGEFMILLGPSGSGKTTILRCIAGLERPTEGEIYLDGELINDVPPKDRDMAMVFQSYALYPHMKVYDNIAFPLKLRKVGKREIDKRVREVAEMLRIGHLLDRKPNQLSGGEQQRVALARAIVRRPKVFLMDEPLSNLDAKLRVYMRAELKKLQEELKVTTVYVTHDQVEAMTMADKIIVLNRGEVQQIGRPHDLYYKPSNLFVAGFIGSPPMNFFQCIVKVVEDNVYLESPHFKLRIPGDLGLKIVEEATSDEVILGVRPEHLGIGREAGENAIKASVFVVEPLGGETIIDFKVGDDIYKLKYPGEINLKTGDIIYVKPDISKIYIFDKKTERAII